MPPLRASAAARATPLRRMGGFTLIEILVVVVIIGIIAASATLSLGLLGRDSEAEDQMRRFWAVMAQVSEESELQGLDTGVFISADGYEFLRFDPLQNRWLPIQDDSLLRMRTLPEGLRFRMWLESRAVVLKPGAVDRSDNDEDKKWPPQVLVLSSGEIQPFELHVERDNAPAAWRVDAMPDNDLRLERRKDTDSWELVSQTRPADVEDDKNVRKTLGKGSSSSTRS